MEQQALLKLRNVHVHYSGVKALDGVSISVDEGEVVALMGPNGAGKSTILRAVFGLAPLDSGHILWHNGKLVPVAYEMVKLGISFVPQGRRVFRHLTVEENLELGGYVFQNRTEINRRIEEVLGIFPHLQGKRKSKSAALSGGQQQMLAIGRALMTDPKVLLLDEPSLGLAPKIIKEVFAAILGINQKRKTAIVIVEHNIKTLLEFATRGYVLDKGKVAAEGTGREILKSGILEKVFLNR